MPAAIRTLIGKSEWAAETINRIQKTLAGSNSVIRGLQATRQTSYMSFSPGSAIINGEIIEIDQSFNITTGGTTTGKEYYYLTLEGAGTNTVNTIFTTSPLDDADAQKNSVLIASYSSGTFDTIPRIGLDVLYNQVTSFTSVSEQMSLYDALYIQRFDNGPYNIQAPTIMSGYTPIIREKVGYAAKFKLQNDASYYNYCNQLPESISSGTAGLSSVSTLTSHSWKIPPNSSINQSTVAMTDANMFVHAKVILPAGSTNLPIIRLHDTVPTSVEVSDIAINQWATYQLSLTDSIGTLSLYIESNDATVYVDAIEVSSNSSTDFIGYGANGGLNIQNAEALINPQEGTIGMRIKIFETPPTSKTIMAISKVDANTGDPKVLKFDLDGQRNLIIYSMSNDSSSIRTSLPEDSWQFIFFTWQLNGSKLDTKIYLSSVVEQRSSTGVMPPIDIAPDSILHLGWDGDTNTSQAPIEITDFFITDYAMSGDLTSRIAKLKNPILGYNYKPNFRIDLNNHSTEIITLPSAVSDVDFYDVNMNYSGNSAYTGDILIEKYNDHVKLTNTGSGNITINVSLDYHDVL